MKLINITDTIDYEELRKLFKKLISKLKIPLNTLEYEWVNNNYFTNKNILNIIYKKNQVSYFRPQILEQASSQGLIPHLSKDNILDDKQEEDIQISEDTNS